VVDKKVMAKNTFMLYGRMLLIMFATFYTSRMVLEALGVYDFGLYSLVGSIIVLFSFIQNVSALATQRFLSVGLGKGDFIWVNKVFNTSVLVHLIICGLIFVLAETLGLWFLLHKLKIPEARLNDVFWVYQLSIVSLLIQIMQTPFIASMIACEKMDLFAKIGIFDAFQRWFMVFLFTLFGFENKIVWYAAFLLVGYSLVFIVYYSFCTSRLSICKVKIRPKENHALLKEIFFFSSWSMLGSLSVVGLSQGIALLTYYFVGVVANGAIWLAEQILIAFNRIIGTLQTAFNPQIIKQYSVSNHQEVASLLSLSCKLTAFVVMISAIPVFVDADVIAGIWLNKVPEYLVDLIKIVVIYILIDSLSGPYVTAIYAVGKLKNYQIIVSAIMLSSLLLTFILYFFGFSVYVAVSARILCAFFLLMFRVFYVNKAAGVSAKKFLFDEFPRLVLVAVVSMLLSDYFNNYLMGGFIGLILLALMNFAIVIIMFSLFVVKSQERKNIVFLIRKRF
jgi:O-antigen/teichoic acid export membrane protein